MSSVAKDLAKLIAQSTEKKVGPYDTKAVVKRVEGNTAWVTIPGGVDETPISRTIDCSKGDTVQVRVSGGTAWITGNVTDPPTSNKKAEQALNKAKKAAQSAARGLTSDTIYYLASDQDSGVTVDTPGWTEEPQEITEALPYLWIYHLYTYADGRTETTEPCIVGVYGPQGEQGEQGEQGDPGDPGAPGVSVTSVTPRYYLSTSSSSTIGGSWSDSLPTYVSGRYYWTRDKITYSNGTTGYSTATYSPGLTESVQLSYNTAQHFWVQTTGTTAVPTGAYVTEQTESGYKSNPTGGATLIRSDKVDIRVGTKTYSRFDGNGTHIYDGNGTADSNVLAEFTGSGARIGKVANGQFRTNFESNKMEFLYRTSQGAESSIAKIDVNGISFKGHADPLGTTKYGEKLLVNVNSGAQTNGPVETKLELGLGRWIVTAWVQFQSDSTGRRWLAIRDETFQYNYQEINQPAVSGAVTSMSTTAIISSETNGSNTSINVYPRVFQNSGGILVVDFKIEAIRIW